MESGGEVEKKQQPIETRQLAVTPPATPAYTTADECHSLVLILSNRFSFYILLFRFNETAELG